MRTEQLEQPRLSSNQAFVAGATRGAGLNIRAAVVAVVAAAAALIVGGILILALVARGPEAAAAAPTPDVVGYVDTITTARQPAGPETITSTNPFLSGGVEGPESITSTNPFTG